LPAVVRQVVPGGEVPPTELSKEWNKAIKPLVLKKRNKKVLSINQFLPVVF
jgi:hypothetical protein